MTNKPVLQARLTPEEASHYDVLLMTARHPLLANQQCLCVMSRYSEKNNRLCAFKTKIPHTLLSNNNAKWIWYCF